MHSLGLDTESIGVPPQLSSLHKQKQAPRATLGSCGMGVLSQLTENSYSMVCFNLPSSSALTIMAGSIWRGVALGLQIN